MHRRTTITALLLALMSAARAAEQSQPPRPVLLELFTSESCSSCPPADAYVASMQGRTDVLPLTFHVDYWNDLGWKDRYSLPQFTRRQDETSSQTLLAPQDDRGGRIIGVAVAP